MSKAGLACVRLLPRLFVLPVCWARTSPIIGAIVRDHATQHAHDDISENHEWDRPQPNAGKKTAVNLHLPPFPAPHWSRKKHLTTRPGELPGQYFPPS